MKKSEPKATYCSETQAERQIQVTTPATSSRFHSKVTEERRRTDTIFHGGVYVEAAKEGGGGAMQYARSGDCGGELQMGGAVCTSEGVQADRPVQMS